MVRLVVLLSGVVLLTSPPLSAQEFSVTPYVGLGPGTNGPTAASGVRIELRDVWGGYVRAAVRAVSNACETSLPPTCTYPEGRIREYAAGVLYRFRLGDTWHSSAGLGTGFLSWQGEYDPFVEASVELRRGLSSRLGLVLGLQAVVAPGVEREPRGVETIVPDRTVSLPNGIVGLSILLG